MKKPIGPLKEQYSPLDFSPPLSSGIFWVLMAFALALFCADNWAPVEQIDDAYISFQYARNLAAGHGLVFNIGERIEGFTNLLWTLLIACGIKLGFAAVDFCRALSLISSAVLLLLSGFYTALFLPAPRRWLAGLAPLLLLATNSFACWTASGLETALFGCFIVLALCSSLREQMSAATFWCMLATLTRPEGAMYAAIILGSDWLLRIYRLPNKNSRIVYLNSYTILTYLLFIVCYTGWRFWYYGDLLPNTFYAKVGGVPYSHGLIYLEKFALDGPGILLLPALITAAVVPSYRVAFICLPITAMYCVTVGGDVFRHGRFLLPILPILIAGAIVGVSWAYSVRKIVALALLSLLPISIAWSLYGPLANDDYQGAAVMPLPISTKRISAQNHTATGGVGVTKMLLASIATLSPPVKVVASIGIGQIAFLADDIYILDLLGLVDKRIAHSNKLVSGDVNILPGHQRTDSDYVLDRKPDLILIPKSGVPLPLKNIPAIYDLWHNPRLEQLYYWDDKIPAYRLRPAMKD